MLSTNGYDLAEQREKIKNTIEYLKEEAENNNTETVLLSNDEVMDILFALTIAKRCIDYRLKKLVEKEEDWN